MALSIFDPTQTPAAGANLTNILINGGMEFWQRGVSFSSPASGVYTADRWFVNRDGTPTFTVSQDASNVDSGTYSLKLNVTAVGGATNIQLRQKVENFKEYANKILSLSARVKSNIAGIQIRLDDGVSNNYVSNTHSGGNTFETLTASGLMGPTTSAVQITLGNSAASAAISTVYFDSVMLVIGSQPVTFVPKNYQTELAQCQRYFEKSYLPDIAPGTSTTTNVLMNIANGGNGQSYSAMFMFKVEKRTNPTITVYTTGGTSGQFEWGTVGGASTARVSAAATSGGVVPTHGFEIRQTVNATDNSCNGHYTAECEL